MNEKSTLQEVKKVYSPSAEIEKAFEVLLTNAQVKSGLDFLQADNENTAEEQIKLTSIPAPTFAEDERGRFYQQRLNELGIKEVKIDRVGNVFGIRPGSGNGPRLVVCAHLDTVFPAGTDTVAKRKEGKIYAPGISDDGRGLAVVLTLVRALNAANIETEGDLIIGATVGEEGLGDLRGVKALFNDRDDIDGFISIEPGKPERTTYLGTGSKRYSITFKGPGGHSFGDFGIPSPIHALGRAIAKISEIVTAKEPKTTYNVGLISGGTSVNTISETANMFVDMRSTSQQELEALESKVLSILKEAANEENQRWDSEAITLDIKLVGDRPAGSQDAFATIVQTAMGATKALGFEPELGDASSTDSNVPIYLGIPAVTLGGGGDFGGAHTLNEYFDPTDAFYGAQKIFLTILGLVGVQNVSSALLEKRAK